VHLGPLGLCFAGRVFLLANLLHDSLDDGALHRVVPPIRFEGNEGNFLSEFGLSGKYFIIHARRPQSHFHFSCRVPGLAGHALGRYVVPIN
jgi:hypothetical protein